MLLRMATIDDAAVVYEWRNHPDVRACSFDSNPLKFETHIEWFKSSLKMIDRHLFIAEIDSEPVGVLRFDIVGSQAEISIYLSPLHKGKGMGVSLLNEGKKWICLNFNNIECLRAQILLGNIASIKAFEKAGFKRKSYVYECDLS